MHFLVAPFAEIHAEPLSPDLRVHPQPQVDGRRRAGKDAVRLVPHDGSTPLLLENNVICTTIQVQVITVSIAYKVNEWV